MSIIKKIILIQGANLTYLGKREPEIYGRTTPDELNTTLLDYAERRNFELEIFYTNVEGEAINRIYRCADQGFDGLVMNPAGFSYSGYALKDCIKGAGLPYVEIHISNVAKRNIHCVLSEVSVGVITGFGMYGYQLALDAMLQHLTGGSLPGDPDHQNWGNLAFAIDPDLLVGRESFLKNVDRTIAHIKGLKRTDPARDIRLPGEFSFIRSEQAIATQELEIDEDLFRTYQERILSPFL